MNSGNVGVLKLVYECVSNKSKLVLPGHLEQANIGVHPLITTLNTPEEVVNTVDLEGNGAIVHVKTVNTLECDQS